MIVYWVIYIVLIAIIGWVFKSAILKNSNASIPIALFTSVGVFVLTLLIFTLIEAAQINTAFQQIQLALQDNAKPNFIIASASALLFYSIIRSAESIKNRELKNKDDIDN
jgi:uncharacterized membrane protein YhdT